MPEWRNPTTSKYRSIGQSAYILYSACLAPGIPPRREKLGDMRQYYTPDPEYGLEEAFGQYAAMEVACLCAADLQAASPLRSGRDIVRVSMPLTNELFQLSL